ncbi:MAG: hypothetical protein ABW221_21560 [Vicinamibacteria bacterium]
MNRLPFLAVAFLAVLAGPAAVQADVWDTSTDNDDNSGTDNELIHGSTQVHDLGVRPGNVADQDWYRIGQKPHSSYEVVLDGTTGDITFSPNMLQRVNNSGTTVLQNSVGVAPGLEYSRTLRWANTTTALVNNEYVRVAFAACGTACTVDDTYHIRARETTIGVARFNATGTQATVVLTQNVSDAPVDASLFFWSASGALLHTQTIAGLQEKSLNAFNVGTVPALAGQSGHLTIAHSGSHGALNVKAVALEPATGFSFDTPGVYRQY